jgi:hypothetical protein
MPAALLSGFLGFFAAVLWAFLAPPSDFTRLFSRLELIVVFGIGFGLACSLSLVLGRDIARRAAVSKMVGWPRPVYFAIVALIIPAAFVSSHYRLNHRTKFDSQFLFALGVAWLAAVAIAVASDYLARNISLRRMRGR